MTKKRINMTQFYTILILIIMGCSEDNDTSLNSNQDVINIENAKLADFRLFGITPVSVSITQPVIVNNEEIEFGEITIVIPNTVSLNGIASSITSEELNLSKFDILPGNSTTLNYETQSHVHTIVNTLNKSQELLHYTVNIKQEVIPTPPTLTVTDFKFEASKNPQLSDDIIIERRAPINNSRGQYIYLFVPAGTNFSDLKPTITFDAEEVFYTQDSSVSIEDVNTPYPTTETSFDFAYPKSFILVLRDKSNSEVKWVNVFVDVKNPVEIENTHITTPDVITPGDSEYFTGITTFKNIGNHNIAYRYGATYENKVPNASVDVITADRGIGTGGLEPGMSAPINVQVSGNLPVGEYKSTAVFQTIFYRHNAIDDLIEVSKLNITANVIN